MLGFSDSRAASWQVATFFSKAKRILLIQWCRDVNFCHLTAVDNLKYQGNCASTLVFGVWKGGRWRVSKRDGRDWPNLTKMIFNLKENFKGGWKISRPTSEGWPHNLPQSQKKRRDNGRKNYSPLDIQIPTIAININIITSRKLEVVSCFTFIYRLGPCRD